jgi:hypothetical protein
VPSSSFKSGGLTSTVTSPAGFLFPGQIPIDPENTLDQLTGRFRAVRDGLPELVKNSKDQYSRLKVVDREHRQIVVIADTKKRVMGVLDFAGAPAANYAGWATWSNPKAGHAELAADIEAGHGNGGKAFMVRGATDYAFMESVYNGNRTKMGFDNRRADARYQPGFMIDHGVAIDDAEEAQPRMRLDEYLSDLGLTFEQLPEDARRVFEQRKAFTGVLLSRVLEWANRRQPTLRRTATEITEILASHGQTAMTIETCDVWVIVDGKVASGSPIRPIALEPYEGFEEPREYVIPDVLPDPETGESIAIPGDVRVLRLNTSSKQLQISPETRAKNVIRVWNERNNVATWPLNSLGVLVTSVSFMFGELRCSALTAEHQAGAERHDLAPTPLARALKKWTHDRVEELALELNKAMAAATKPKERDHARNALNQFRDLMRKFLDRDATGAEDDQRDKGEHGDDGDGTKRKKEPFEFGERLDQLVLELGSGDMIVAVGATIPLSYQALEVQPDASTKPVRGADLVVKTEPEDVVQVDQRGNLTAVAAGLVTIWLETADGAVESNRKEVWAVESSGVDGVIPHQPLLQGQKVKLALTFHTSEGPVDDVLIDAEVIPPDMGKIGRHGRFTAGMHEGEATVRVRYGPAESDIRDFVLAIGADRVEPRKGEGGKGADIPLILLCGEPAPGMEEYPENARTVPPGPNYPTIVEDRALFPGIVWLNPNSKEAERVRTSGVGGSSGVLSLETKTFTHFVALKCFEILKRLHIRQQIAGEAVTEDQYMQAAAYSEIECADFIDAAWDLSDQILNTGASAHG